MNREQFGEAKRIFGEALEVPDAEREMWVKSEAGTDEEVEREVLRLLRAHGRAKSFLGGEEWEEERERERQVGGYLLEKEIGTGGSGTVFLGRRADGLHGEAVAVKLLDRVGQSAEGRKRFLREVRTLAQMRHENIVRLLDGGVSEGGTPYLVTEWVDGETLDAHARRLDLWSRVERMVAVCGAVAAAHGSLIVHRDLKPGNILVDRAGVVKLLDFGISVAEDEGERLTMTGMNRMTAAYASPEQLRAEREVRTASDVYSLGVILHELASGESPYGDLRQISSYELPGFILGLEEWNGGARSGIADRDLRAIVQQAMRRAPEERYETAAAMRDDLERWLRGEAVAARGRSRAYLAKKFVRRHWAAIVTMAAAFAVVSGLGIAAWRNARAAEERNARIFALVMEELTDATVSQRTLRGRQGLGVSANLMDVRVRSVRRMVAESPGDRKLRRGLLFLLAERAPMLGYPSAISLGRTAEAEAAYREMVAVGERLLREEDDVDVRSQVINGLVGLGTVLLEMGRNEEAGREFGRARELVESSERSQLRRLQGLEARGHLARILNLQGKREESLRLREEVVAGREREYKTRGEELAWGYAGAVVSRAYLLREMGRAREALGEYERVLPLIERNARREERDLTSQWNLARQYEETGRCAEAVGDTPAAAEWYEKAVAIYRRIGMLEPDAWSNWRALAVCLWRQAGLGTGSPYLRKVEALDLARRAAAHDPASVKAKREVAEMERKGI